MVSHMLCLPCSDLIDPEHNACRQAMELAQDLIRLLVCCLVLECRTCSPILRNVHAWICLCFVEHKL